MDSSIISIRIGAIVMKVGDLIMLATNLQPFWMGIAVSVLCPLINMVVRKLGWVKDGDMTLS